MAKRAVRKTYKIPPDLVAQAKRILGSKTETDAIVRSLRDVVFMDEVARAVRTTAGALPHVRRV